jgi:hypothetical protein
MSQLALDLNLHPKQGVALLSKATEILYGGAAGGGKSFLMRVMAIMFCSAIPGLQVYIFRRISADLIKNHMEGPKGLRAMLAPWVMQGFVTIVESEIRFWNGSKIYLCHCEHEKNIYNYQGAEIHLLLIDEITHFTESMYRFLRNRVRMVGITVPPQYAGMFPRILCGGNPGNIGHLWVKAAFVDAGAEMQLRRMPANEGGMLRQYIPARLEDNPSMADDDPGYEGRLEGLGSAALVKAMRFGDWNVIEGAYFDCWDPEKHVIRPFEIPKHWFRFRGFDWGSSKPFATLWLAVSDGSVPSIPKGALVAYREYYGASAPNVGLKMQLEDVARAILAKELGDADDQGRKPLGVADPAIFAEDGGPSQAETMARVGCQWKRGDNKRVPGWSQVRDRLLGEDGRPMLYFFSNCVNVIRTLPALQHDENRPEDVDTDGEDHIADALRYACMARPYLRTTSPKETMRGLPDMTMDELWQKSGTRRETRI